MSGDPGCPTLDSHGTIYKFQPYRGLLGDTNQYFHDTYDKLLADTVRKLGKEIPVIVTSSSDVTLIHNGTQTTEQFIPETYHELKSASHMAFALQLTLTSQSEGSLEAETRIDLQNLLAHISVASGFVEEIDLPEQVGNAPRCVLELCRATIEGVLAEDSVDLDAVLAFTRSIAPFLLKNGDYAARLELDGLHQIVTDWRQEMEDGDWNSLYAVVCGGHQSRYRQVAKQYFQRLLEEDHSSAAECEERVLYAEGMIEIEAALDLLARHIIDQRAAHMFFGDRCRLQRDLLSDMAAKYLNKLLPVRALSAQ